MVNQIQRDAPTQEDLNDSIVSSRGRRFRKGGSDRSRDSPNTCLRTQRDLRRLAESVKPVSPELVSRKGADLRVEEASRPVSLRHTSSHDGEIDGEIDTDNAYNEAYDNAYNEAYDDISEAPGGINHTRRRLVRGACSPIVLAVALGCVLLAIILALAGW